MSSEKIGKFIQERRKTKNLTQEELGERLGVSSKSISRWENNITMPDLSLITTIAKELNVEVSELLNGRRMTKEELIKLRDTVNRIIKYSGHKEKNKSHRTVKHLFTKSICIFLTIIDLIFGLSRSVFNEKIAIAINVLLLLVVFILNFVTIHVTRKDIEFKVDNLFLDEE